MDPLRTEEDQIRALKQWWQDNGSSTLIGVGLAIAIVFGWQWWKQRGVQSSEQAAVVYQQLIQATELAADDVVQRTTAEHLARQLKEEQPGTRHADYAALILARLNVEKPDLAAAELELKELAERQSDMPAGAVQVRINRLLGRYADPQIGALARLRLARVQLALDRKDEALATLDAARSDDFAMEKAELRGDILRARGDLDGALSAYVKAIELAGDTPGRLLELKKQELDAMVPVPAPAPAPAPATDTAVAPGAAAHAEATPTPTAPEDKP